CDVSFCGLLHGVSRSATGVGRVIESTAERLRQEPGLAFAMTGCRGDDPRPAYTNVEAWQYWKARWAGRGVPFLETIPSPRFPFYREALYTLNREPHPDAFRRIMRRGVNAVARWEGRAARLTGIDLFHSPFFALPPRSVIGPVPRVL